MRPASILSLSYPVISACQPALGTIQPRRNGNVCLPNPRGKLHNHFYNPLQSKEFRVNRVISRFIGWLSRLQQAPELAYRVWAGQKGSHHPQRPQTLQRRLRTHSKVYELARGSDRRNVLGVANPPPARRDHHVSNQRELLGQLALLRSKIRFALFAEDLTDRLTLATLDLLVQVQECATKPLGHGLTDRRLPGSWKADEDHVRSRGISRRAGSRGAKDRRHNFGAFRGASRRQTFRERRRPTPARASPRR